MRSKRLIIDSQRATDAKTDEPATGSAKFRSFMIRHRVTIQDLSVLFAIMLVAAFVAFEFDIYENQDSVSVREETIELDEALTLGGILCVGLLIFSVRRYYEQKQETRRRATAEQLSANSPSRIP